MQPIKKYKNTNIYRNFMKKVSVTQSCWLWQGAISEGRYGKFRIKEKTLFSHRASWQIFKGDIPHGKNICHRCDNEKCVNPDHLFCGTQEENLRDMISKNRCKPAHNGQHLKLTQEMADIIRSDHRSHKHIAEEWMISCSTVSNIKNGKTWNRSSQ